MDLCSGYERRDAWVLHPPRPMLSMPRAATRDAGVMVPQERLHRCLVFEGGGGKASVFVGALRALEEVGLLASQNDELGNGVQHFVGSSTGAIIAALLASGASSIQIEHILSQAMNTLIDAGISKTRTRPSLRVDDASGVAFSCSPVETVRTLPPLLQAGLRRYAAVAGVLGSILPLEKTSSRFRHWMLERIGTDSSLVDFVLADVPAAIWALYLDGGLLDAADLRQQIDEVLSARIAERTGRELSNVTLRQHHAIFGRELSLVATNVSRGQSLAFTRFSTPDLPLADAIRICISLPPLVKPVYFSPNATDVAGGGPDYAGLWIDGGSLNTAAINRCNNVASPRDSLRLRLGSDLSRHFPEPVDQVPILRFLPPALLELIWSAAAKPTLETAPSPVLTLDCGAVSTHRFVPEPGALQRAQSRAYDDVKRYLEGW